MNNTSRIDRALRLLAETAAIVFGVLLALFLDDWRQSLHEREQLGSTLVRLQVELERNQTGARDPDRHVTRASPTSSRPCARGTGRLLPLSELGADQPMSTGASLVMDAWFVARSSGTMTSMDVEDLFLLSTVYSNAGGSDRGPRSARAQAGHVRPSGHRGGASDLRARGVPLRRGGNVLARERFLCDAYRRLAGRFHGGEGAGPCGSGRITIR